MEHISQDVRLNSLESEEELMPDPFGPGSVLAKTVQTGTVPLYRLDDMVTCLVAAWYKLGQDQDFPPLDVTANVLSAADNYLARELGAKSAVLLKNTSGALPLKKVASH
jgi:beta-glucosidase-like glycosyl hydrolase